MADVPAMAAVTTALWSFLAALERRGAWRVAAAALAIGAALLAKYSTWVLLGAAFGSILALEALRGRRAAAGRGAVAVVAGVLAPAIFALVKPGLVQRQLALLAGFQWEGLRRWVESYPSTFLFQTHPLLAAAALAALWRGWRERDRRVLVAAALPLVLFALGARRSRYLIPVFPMIALLAARGLEALPGRSRRFAALAAAGFSLVTVFAVYLPFLTWVNTANLQEAGRFLDEHGVARRRGDGAAGAGRGDQPRGRGAAAGLPHRGADHRARPGRAAPAAGGAARLLVPVHLGTAASGVVSRRRRGAIRRGAGPDHRRPRRRNPAGAGAEGRRAHAGRRLRPRRGLPLPDARLRLALPRDGR